MKTQDSRTLEITEDIHKIKEFIDKAIEDGYTDKVNVHDDGKFTHRFNRMLTVYKIRQMTRIEEIDRIIFNLEREKEELIKNQG